MINNWVQNLKKHLKILPGESSHVDMIPYRLPSSSFKIKHKNVKLSAVLCLLFEKNNNIHCILMERTKDGGKHSGQISFPGGKKEDSDSNFEYTALRETHEEIGIPPDSVEILGELTQVYIPVSNFLIQPFIGVIDSNFVLNISPSEVQSTFNFPITDLLNDNNKQFKTIKNHNGIALKNIPCFILSHKTVWGATALILNELKTIFINLKTAPDL